MDYISVCSKIAILFPPSALVAVAAADVVFGCNTNSITHSEHRLLLANDAQIRGTNSPPYSPDRPSLALEL